MFSLAYQAIYRFFTLLMRPLNKDEPQVPLPFDVQREMNRRELERINADEREYKARLRLVLPPDAMRD